jgi:nicotinamidase-related amidase
MQALIVLNPQNEFSPEGIRPVANHAEVIAHIAQRVEEFRLARRPIAWIKHYNKPREPQAFTPKSWGAEFTTGFGPCDDGPEKMFTKDLDGAFTFTGLQEWLLALGIEEVLIVGFTTHRCVSSTAREAVVRGFTVYIDPFATGSRPIEHETLGLLSAEEVHRSALIHLSDMGVRIVNSDPYFGLDAICNDEAELSQM